MVKRLAGQHESAIGCYEKVTSPLLKAFQSCHALKRHRQSGSDPVPTDSNSKPHPIRGRADEAQKPARTERPHGVQVHTPVRTKAWQGGWRQAGAECNQTTIPRIQRGVAQGMRKPVDPEVQANTSCRGKRGPRCNCGPSTPAPPKPAMAPSETRSALIEKQKSTKRHHASNRPGPRTPIAQRTGQKRID